MNILSSVAIGWLGRRVLDWGGWLGTFLLSIIGIYNSLPPGAQEAIQSVLSGRWQDITLGAIIPLAALVWSQVVSFRATVKPQVVTSAGRRLENLPAPIQADIEATAAVAPRRRTLADLLAEKLGRR
jgi:hypothetical protein